ncbi:MAG: esterase family protein, partial [Pyrinomonadaceae bacterium]|nr:esterase family protein [Phycisphaerales bacterium]
MVLSLCAITLLASMCGGHFADSPRVHTQHADAWASVFAGAPSLQPVDPSKLVQPESLPQGFILVVTDKSGAATSDSPIYLASNHNGWNPLDAAWKLTQRSDGKWQIVLPKPKLDSRMAFKFTRGSWDAEELDAKFGKIENRSLPKVDLSKLAGDEKPIIELAIEQFSDKAPKDAISSAKDPYRAINATGTIRRVEVVGGGVVLTRDLLVWLPPGYDDAANVTRRYPVLYLQDGQNVFEKLPGVPGEWEADEAATRLIGERAIEPIIIVGIPNAGEGRIAEYSPIELIEGVTAKGDAYVDFLTREVMPRVERVFRIKGGAANTAIGGSSLGGVISLYAATRHPDIFGKVLAESTPLEFRGRSL